MSLKIRVITPDKIVLNTSSDAIVLPSTSGQLGILTDHAPLITALEVGVLRFRSEDDWNPIILLGGFAEVEDNEVTILVNGVEEVSTIDMTAAKKDLDTASAELLKAETSEEKIEASQKLKKASARVQAAAFVK